MFQPLAGRLKWERTADGIRVEIPPSFHGRKDWQNATYFGLLLCVFIWGILARILGTSHAYRPSYFLALVLFPFYIYMGFAAIRSRLERVTLTLNPARLSVRTTVFGIAGSTHLPSARMLHNPRLGRSGQIAGYTKQIADQLQIDRDYRTIVLANGVTKEEATALIAKMMEVYPFPKYLPTGAEASAQDAPLRG